MLNIDKACQSEYTEIKHFLCSTDELPLSLYNPVLFMSKK